MQKDLIETIGTSFGIGFDGSIIDELKEQALAVVAYDKGRAYLLGLRVGEDGEALDTTSQSEFVANVLKDYGIKIPNVAYIVVDKASTNVVALQDWEGIVIYCFGHHLKNAIKPWFKLSHPNAHDTLRLFSNAFYKAPTREVRWVQAQKAVVTHDVDAAATEDEIPIAQKLTALLSLHEDGEDVEADILECLGEGDGDMLERAKERLTQAQNENVFKKLRIEIPALTQAPLSNAAQNWDPEFVDNLVWAVSSLKPNILDDLSVSTSPDDIIGAVSNFDETVEGLRDLRDEARAAGMPEARIARTLFGLFCAIERCGGERTLALAFENASVSLSVEGFTSACEVVQTLFDAPDRRAGFARLLMKLPDLELHRIAYGSNDTPRTAKEIIGMLVAADEGGEHVDVTSKFAEMLPGAFVQCFAHLVIELTVEAAIRIFYELCGALTMFDLRDVLSGYSSRRRIVFLVYDVCFATETDLVNPFDTISSDSVPLLENWLGRPIGTFRVSHPVQAKSAQRRCHASGQWRLGFLKTALEVDGGDGIYSGLLSQLSTLTEVQLKVLVEELVILLSDTITGRVLLRYLDSAKRQCETKAAWETWIALNDTIDLLRLRCKVSPAVVRQQLDNYDADAFSGRTKESQNKALSNLIDDGARSYLFYMSPRDLRITVFTYLKAFGPVTRKKFIKVTRERHQSSWTTLVSAYQSAPPATALARLVMSVKNAALQPAEKEEPTNKHTALT
ncbi:hypothetical protein DIPPA_32374 [Diplonema papillatum]|nr:hypothetical protein DIPPA_32374 [Diplonema papillatum]